MSDAVDTEMLQAALAVVDQARKQFKRQVLARANQESDTLARQRADEVLLCFSELRYASQRRNQELLLLELEQLCHQLQRAMAWSAVSRPFDVGAYQQTLEAVDLAQCAIHSALGLFRPCPQLFARAKLHPQQR